MRHKIRQTRTQLHRSPNEYFDLAIYAGFLTFVFALPFGHATEILIQPSGISGVAPDTWWHARADRRNGLFELEKYLYYRVMYLLRLTP